MLEEVMDRFKPNFLRGIDGDTNTRFQMPLYLVLTSSSADLNMPPSMVPIFASEWNPQAP